MGSAGTGMLFQSCETLLFASGTLSLGFGPRMSSVPSQQLRPGEVTCYRSDIYRKLQRGR